MIEKDIEMGLEERQVLDSLPSIDSWDDLIKVVKSIENFWNLRLREPEIEKKYKRYQYWLDKMRVPRKEPIIRKMGEADLIVVENRFAYGRLINNLNLMLKPKGQKVVHLLVFSRRAEVRSEEISNLLETDELGGGKIDWIDYENDESHKSIRELAHRHVFLLKNIEGNNLRV